MRNQSRLFVLLLTVAAAVALPGCGATKGYHNMNTLAQAIKRNELAIGPVKCYSTGTNTAACTEPNPITQGNVLWLSVQINNSGASYTDLGQTTPPYGHSYTG